MSTALQPHPLCSTSCSSDGTCCRKFCWITCQPHGHTSASSSSLAAMKKQVTARQLRNFTLTLRSQNTSHTITAVTQVDKTGDAMTLTWLLYLHKLEEGIQYTNCSSKRLTITFQLLCEPSQQGYGLITCARADILVGTELVARL